MQVGIAWGRQRLELEVLEKNLLQPARAPELPLADPVHVLRNALERPLDYPALWRALTPEDHVAIVVDEGIPTLAGLLIALLEHIRQVGIRPEAITLLCLPPSAAQPWIDELPDEYQDVRVEVHQPGDRRKLAYLATTKLGRRIYLNRTAVDADQLILLTRRNYDPLAGYGGAELVLYPGLCDEATRLELGNKLDQRDPYHFDRPVQKEAREVAWLLGAPFFIQIIEGSGDTIENILTGPLESGKEGERLLNKRWQITVEHPADVVIASMTGDPARKSIDDLARAFFSSARVVKPGGSIVLLTDAAPSLAHGIESFRQHDDPGLALCMLHQEKTADLMAGSMWALAALQAKLYLLSGLPSDLAEEIFTIPLQNAQQTQNLLTAHATCLFLPDADKSLAILK